MARPATGSVIEDKRKRDTTFALRFSALGRKRYQRLGRRSEGWDRARAQTELDNVLADVRRGRWKPPAVALETPQEAPSFHRFATDWLHRQAMRGGQRGSGLTLAGRADLEWRLSKHLLKTFASKRLDEISIEDVDAFSDSKRREGLSPTSVNKMLDTLAAILELAAEHGHIEGNPAKGRGRRLKAASPRRSWLDRADHIAALLDGAGELDDHARVRRGQRRALLATLALAGLRIDEALSLRWRDVDLARGTITVRASKTDAGIRMVNVLPILRDELDAYRSRLDPSRDALVFATSTGAKQGATNVRRRILAPAVEEANKQLVKAKVEPLPEGLTPHSLRRTFASLLCAVGETPVYVMAQLGHTNPNLTLRLYAKVMDRRDGEPERLKALVEGRVWTHLDSKTPDGASRAQHNIPQEPVNSGHQGA